MINMFEPKPELPRGIVDVTRYGKLSAIVVTESGATMHFAGGDVVLSLEQAFAILAHQRVKT